MKQKEQKDNRILHAQAVKNLLNHKGYAVLLKEYKKIKEQAFNDLKNESFSKDSISERQKIYNQIEEWISIPKLIVAEGENAIEESKQPEPRSGFIKKSIAFIGRRY